MIEDSDARAVAEANREQLAAWDGDQGSYWAERAVRFNEGVADYHRHLMAVAAIGRGDTVLDIGCGSGQTTRDAARRATEGSALGIDLSSPMIQLARTLALREHVPNVKFQLADAQVHPFPERTFDVVISRHGAMFFGDPHAAFANIARAVRPGGRLVLLTWQPARLNQWMDTFRRMFLRDRPPPPAEGTPGTRSLSEPGPVRDLLTSAGFADVQLRDLREQMYFGQDPEDACAFLAGQFGWLMADLDEIERVRALENLRSDLAAHQTERGIRYDSAAWLIEARRR